jgi:hypothetical protein
VFPGAGLPTEVLLLETDELLINQELALWVLELESQEGGGAKVYQSVAEEVRAKREELERVSRTS